MKAPFPSASEVLRHFARVTRPVHARELAVQVGVSEKSLPRLLTLLEGLVATGALRRLSGDRFKVETKGEKGTVGDKRTDKPGAQRQLGAKPAEQKRAEKKHAAQTYTEPKPTDRKRGDRRRSWEGILGMNPRGFGFVNSVGKADVYVPPDAIAGAMHGDRVEVEIRSESARGLEGAVVRVTERRKPRVAGILRRRRKGAWLEPDDARMRGPIVVTKGALERGQDGEAAIVEITRFPEFPGENPEGELLAILGAPGEPQAEVAKILMREQVDEEHPERAVLEAEALAAKIRPLEIKGRVDLRHLPLPTLDPDDARDHDDAIWVERSESGFRAYIAIADVSEYVRPNTALDEEALSRGCTIYLPDRALPMLPSALAADLCSLLPEKDRLCVCIIADLNRQAEVVHFEIVEGVMRSQAMLTYGGVARALGFSDKPKESAQAETFKSGLRRIDELSRKLRERRLESGALDLNLPEPKVALDLETGRPESIGRRTEDPGVKRAYNMVEELMLLANELAARWLIKQKSPAIFRVHARPDEMKLERLAKVSQALGVPFDREEITARAGAATWLKSIADHPRRAVLEMLLLRSLKQAVYDTDNIGHFGLASEYYVHFTSPIRRYPDILVHRAIKHLLRGGKPDKTHEALEVLQMSATCASQRERAAMEVEREVVDLYRAIYMQDHVGETAEGSVSGIGPSGLYVTLDEPFVDVLVRFDNLGGDHYEVSDDELAVVGVRNGERVGLGDRVRVVVEEVLLSRRQVLARRVVDGADPKGRTADTPRSERPRKQGRGQSERPRGRPSRIEPRPTRSTPRMQVSGRKPSRGTGSRRGKRR